VNNDQQSQKNLLEESQKLQERLEESGWGRIYGFAVRVNGVIADISDVSRKSAARLYRKNWEECRDLWKEEYRQRRKRIFSR
jgi:hypothetical protein